MANSSTNTHLFGQKSVSSAGTAERLVSESTKVVSVVIIAHSDNTGRIFYGASDVDSSTQKGLEAGESVSIPEPMRGVSQAPFDLMDLWIDVGTNGDGVDIVASKYL